jgi:hypothetical protein
MSAADKRRSAGWLGQPRFMRFCLSATKPSVYSIGLDGQSPDVFRR